MITQLPSGKWRLHSKDGSKNLGTFDTKAEALKHEGEVEYFKSHPHEKHKESFMRLMVATAVHLKEAGSGYDPKTGKLTLRVIQPGFNKSKERYYPADVLKRDYRVFEGAKMFANHATDGEDQLRPEGDVNNWVASITRIWPEADGALMAEAALTDPKFKAKLELLNQQNLLHTMGVSIRAIGEASKQKVEGRDTMYVESLIQARSVDFVTFAGAGGAVLYMEAAANEVNDVDLITEADFRQRRPDLVESIIKGARMTAEEQKQLTDALAEVATLKAAGATKDETITAKEAEVKALKDAKEVGGKATRIATAKTEVARLLTESKLPKAAADKLTKQFEGVEKVDGVKEAIAAEEAYIKNFTTIERKNGAGGTGEDKPNLTESFQRLGLSKEEAEKASKL